MDWNTTVDPKAPKAALEAFRQKRAVLPQTYKQLRGAAKARAFTVSCATRLNQVNDMMKAIDRAIEKGQSFSAFKREIKDKITQTWGPKGYALESTFRTNVQAAYQAGRWTSAYANRATRPIGRFSALEDGRICPECNACDGTTLPLDDPWWNTRSPLLHASCRCTIETFRADAVDVTEPHELPDVEIGEGWGQRIGVGEFGDWKPDLAGKDPDAVAVFNARFQLDEEARPPLEDYDEDES